MSRRAARFTEADLRRALKAADASATPKKVDILPDGTICISPAENQGKGRPANLAPRKDIAL